MTKKRKGKKLTFESSSLSPSFLKTKQQTEHEHTIVGYSLVKGIGDGESEEKEKEEEKERERCR